MFNKKTVRDIDVKGKKVLVRVDFNVPMKDGDVGDDTRIRAALPTIEYLVENMVLLSSCARIWAVPKVDRIPNISMKPVADYLAELNGKTGCFCQMIVLAQIAEAAAKALKPGEVLVLENTRFHPEEEKNDLGMAKQLASLADLYVNDAFGTAHRAHASTEGVTHFLPAVAGFLLEKEIKYLGQAIADPKRPFVAILGGAKISDKIGVIKNLLTKADSILDWRRNGQYLLQSSGLPCG